MYQVGNGKSIQVWDSPWLDTNPSFKTLTSKPVDCHVKWASELMTDDGTCWNERLVNQLFMKSEAEAILHMPISLTGIKDKLIWQHTTHGHYTVNSAYEWLSKQLRQTWQQPESCGKREQERRM